MTIPEAVSLVLQSGAMAEDGRVFLLDMGEPASILRMAHQMIRLAGLRPDDDIAIEITGARPGERLHEQLHDGAETVEASDHPSISSLRPRRRLSWECLSGEIADLREACDADDDDRVRACLTHLLARGGVACDLESAVGTGGFEPARVDTGVEVDLDAPRGGRARAELAANRARSSGQLR
jgi:FlaA1/EpsC-like NDP-sugar epimerase